MRLRTEALANGGHNTPRARGVRVKMEAAIKAPKMGGENNSWFLVLGSYLGRSHDQADACQFASVYRGFCSIWNAHFCLRLQPHLYPVPVETSVGRSDGTRQRYKSTHV